MRGARHKVAGVHLALAVPERGLDHNAHEGEAEAGALGNALEGSPGGGPRGLDDQLVGLGNQSGPPVQVVVLAARRANLLRVSLAD